MAFANVSRATLELLHPNYRAPGVAPGAVPPGRGDAAAPYNPNYTVADEFIRVVHFVRADADGEPLARAYQVRSVGDIFEPPFVARAGGTPWTSGATTAFGQDLTFSGARFKKISTVVRSDELMVTGKGGDVMRAEIRMARIGLVRALSEAVLHSNPSSDDDAELAGLPFFLQAGGPQDVQYDPSLKLMGGLAKIAQLCCPSGGDVGVRPDIFVISSQGLIQLTQEHWARNLQLDYSWCPLTGQIQPYFLGLPVLIGRVPEPAASTSSSSSSSSSSSPSTIAPAPPAATTVAYAMKIRGPSAVRILHVGGRSQEYGTCVRPLTTMATITAGEATAATSGSEVYGNYALLVPEPKSFARLTFPYT